MNCACGCGRATNTVKGVPKLFIHGHNGTPPPREPRPLAERLWAKVDKNGPIPAARPDLGPCWQWTSRPDGKGYGQINAGKRPTKMLRAHRVAYELSVGLIPDGLQLDHLCRNRMCVNPEHLEPVPCRENLLRGDTVTARNARVTECPQGHPYSGTNVRYSKRNGARYCNECNRQRAADNRARRINDRAEFANHGQSRIS